MERDIWRLIRILLETRASTGGERESRASSHFRVWPCVEQSRERKRRVSVARHVQAHTHPSLAIRALLIRPSRCDARVLSGMRIRVMDSQYCPKKAAGPRFLGGPRSSGPARLVSRVLSMPVARHERPFLLPRRCRRGQGLCAPSTLPVPIGRTDRALLSQDGELLGLARGGVYHAPAVTSQAVRSYRTLSPLPVPSGI